MIAALSLGGCGSSHAPQARRPAPAPDSPPALAATVLAVTPVSDSQTKPPQLNVFGELDGVEQPVTCAARRRGLPAPHFS